MWNSVLSLDEYRQTLRELLTLEMEYAVAVSRRDHIPPAKAINAYTEAYLLSVYYEKGLGAESSPEWARAAARLETLFLERGNNAFLSGFWDILGPIILPRAAPDREKARSDIANSYNGFMYEFHHEYFQPVDSPELLTLHFRNYFAPKSPFHHQRELAEGLAKLVKKAREERPDVTRAQCASWLNNLAPFTDLFPPEWRRDAVLCPIEGHTGWWGQMIDRKGALHAENAAYLRERGEFKHGNLHCRCAIDFLGETRFPKPPS